MVRNHVEGCGCGHLEVRGLQLSLLVEARCGGMVASRNEQVEGSIPSGGS